MSRINLLEKINEKILHEHIIFCDQTQYFGIYLEKHQHISFVSCSESTIKHEHHLFQTARAF